MNLQEQSILCALEACLVSHKQIQKKRHKVFFCCSGFIHIQLFIIVSESSWKPEQDMHAALSELILKNDLVIGFQSYRNASQKKRWGKKKTPEFS